MSACLSENIRMPTSVSIGVRIAHCLNSRRDVEGLPLVESVSNRQKCHLCSVKCLGIIKCCQSRKIQRRALFSVITLNITFRISETDHGFNTYLC